MEKIKIILEKSANLYSAYAENVEGIYGAGDTPSEAMKSVLEAINLLKEHNSPENIPAILRGNYELEYQFDTSSLLNYYKGIFTNSALERITGINQKQLQHYASGLKKPREVQVQKIERGLHKLAEELLAVKL